MIRIGKRALRTRYERRVLCIAIRFAQPNASDEGIRRSATESPPPLSPPSTRSADAERRAVGFPTDSTHRSRARLIAARVGDYARGTVARSSLGNWPSTKPVPSAGPPSSLLPLNRSPLLASPSPPFARCVRTVRTRRSLPRRTAASPSIPESRVPNAD